MNRFQLGIVVESTGLDFRAALPQAARIGVHGMQVNALGELAADRLGTTGRRELRTVLRSYNLELSALGCPLRRGLDSVENQQQRIEHVQKIMQLAYDLGPAKVIVPCPKLPKDPESAVAHTLRESLRSLAAYGDRIGTTICLEVGLDSGETLKNYLTSFDSGSLRVNFDPANFIINGFDHLESLSALASLIAHTHARDARRSSVSGGPKEVPVGAGDVEWMMYIATLEALDYRGYLCVEREDGNQRLADVAASVAFLKKFIPVEEK